MLHFLKDHQRQPPSLDQGKSIISHRWGQILLHLHRAISSARYSVIMPWLCSNTGNTSLLDNYAVRRLKEKIISQTATQVLFEEGVKYMEQEMEIIDKKKRIDNPPRLLYSKKSLKVV